MSGGSHVRPYSKRRPQLQRIHDSQPVTDGDEPGLRKPETGVHPAAIGIALIAALWFIAVTWLRFARGAEVDWDLAVVTLFFVFFFALFLFTATYALKDPRWRQRDTSLREFLRSEVGTATGPMADATSCSRSRSCRSRSPSPRL